VKELWLLRHGKSSWDDPTLDDYDRPLAPRGKKAAKRIARWSHSQGLRPDLVLCSGALRARETLELVHDALGDPEVEIEESIYHASSETLLELLRTAPTVNRILVVGHNPGLHELTGVLAPPAPAAFPTGALACLALDVTSWGGMRAGCGVLSSLLLPRSLPG
jgi:phosphohistidine phosphatase